MCFRSVGPSAAYESAGVSRHGNDRLFRRGAGRRQCNPAGQAERSPFIRTTELLAPYQPAKPLITLSLGEPQHPVPDFVGPVLAKHIADFGRYPLAKGIEPFRARGSELAVEPISTCRGRSIPKAKCWC